MNGKPTKPPFRAVILAAFALILTENWAVAAKKPHPSGPFISNASILDAHSYFPSIIPYQSWSGLLVLPIRVNSGPFINCLFDPGLPVTTLDPKVAEQSKLTGGNQVTVISPLGPVNAPLAVAQELMLGSITIKQTPIAITNLLEAYTNPVPPNAPVGWIGETSLGQIQFTVDFSRGIVTINRSGTPFDKSAVVVPLLINNQRLYVMASALKGKKFKALVSFGVQSGLIPAQIAEQLKLKSVGEVDANTLNKHSAKAVLVNVPEVSVGRAMVREVSAAYIMPPAGIKKPSDTGVLGLDFWRHFRVTIDIKRRKLALDSLLAAPPIPTHHPKAGHKIIRIRR